MSTDVTESKHVIVIGAGMAGLAAASSLISFGFKNVTILEALDRIGGRIHTYEFGSGSGIVEMGANWIHGKNNNPLYKLAKDLQVPTIVQEDPEENYYTEDGRCLSKSLMERVWKIYKSIDDEVDKYFEENIETSLSIADHMHSRYTEKSSSIPPKDRMDAQSLYNCFLNFSAIDNGDDLDKMSLRYNASFQENGGGNILLTQGYTRFLETFTVGFPNDTVKLKTVVKNITWNNPDNNPSKMKVVCEEQGKTVVHTADHVIVTCSLGVLKETHQQMFTPPLPLTKVQCIERLGFGKIGKIYLEYEKPFWKNGSIFLTWRNDTNAKYTYEEWYRSIHTFEVVYGNPNVLVAWTVGNIASYIETLSEQEVSRCCTMLLRQFLADECIPEPKCIITSKWCSNPYIKGSYTYVAMGATIDDIVTVSEPLFDNKGVPRVLFSGEATHKQWYSCVHGALTSGRRESQRVIDLYSQSSPSCSI